MAARPMKGPILFCRRPVSIAFGALRDTPEILNTTLNLRLEESFYVRITSWLQSLSYLPLLLLNTLQLLI